MNAVTTNAFIKHISNDEQLIDSQAELGVIYARVSLLCSVETLPLGIAK